MDADLDTLVTALYVTADEMLKAHPEVVPSRPLVGIAPKLSDAELITLAVMQAALHVNGEALWVRYTHAHLGHLFPYLPNQSGYNKRLRKLGDAMALLIRVLARSTSVWTDDVWVADSTPIECARSRETVHRSELAGFTEDGYCASHSRYFWGLRLHLVATLHGLPVGIAITGAKADERAVLLDILTDPGLARGNRQTLIADKNYHGRDFETVLGTLTCPNIGVVDRSSGHSHHNLALSGHRNRPVVLTWRASSGVSSATSHHVGRRRWRNRESAVHDCQKQFAIPGRVSGQNGRPRPESADTRRDMA